MIIHGKYEIFNFNLIHLLITFISKINMSKPRVVKDFEKLDEAIQEQIKLNYPNGFEKNLITFKNIENKFVSALPFETEEKYYLVRMSKALAQEIIEEDDDYDEDGILKADIKADYENKYDDEMTEAENIPDS